MNISEKILYKYLSYKIQGLAFAIRNDLGSGRKYRPDFLMENKIIIGLTFSKFIGRKEKEFVRIYDYLRSSGYEPGYLINFGSSRLCIKRFIPTNYRKKWMKALFLLVAISYLFIAVRVISVEAAQLFFDPPSRHLAVEEQFEVNLMLDPENEDINAAEGQIIFNPEILEFQGASDGNSIITLWVENPKLATDEGGYGSGRVLFSGIIPGGFRGILSSEYAGGRSGKIFSLQFKTKKTGEGFLTLEKSRVLLNNGMGGEAKLVSSNFDFRVLTDLKPRLSLRPDLRDTSPPENFKPLVSQIPEISPGKYFLIFSTQDKGTGLERYEVLETKFLNSSAKWIKAQSPYLLSDQNLSSYIYVKAVDRAGNERIEMVPPRHPLRRYDDYLMWFIIIMAVLGIVLVSWRLSKSKIKYQKSQ